jgi:DNA-binding NtrC family response regulator
MVAGRMTAAFQRITNAIERSAPVPVTRLRLFAPGRAPRDVDLPQVGAVLGADEACDVVVTDAAVSSRHLSIVPVEGGFRLRDLGSKNGTWLDDVAVKDLVAPPGTSLRLGRSIVQLLPAEEAVTLAPSEARSFGALRGSSVEMRRVYAILERVSASDAPVLLLGESGTGKELAARAVHDASPRGKGPFVVFDCGAASETLVEGELFGHKRGAFTGAHADRVGAFARAHGGTLFLDEIGDLPLLLQPKLLRLLERGEVTPLGGRKAERYDVRFVAATHRDLWSEVGAGTFRADLFYRLAVVEVHLPALRERRDDIHELVRGFLQAQGAGGREITPQALEQLARHGWPGNVRELRNVVTRAAVLSPPGAPLADIPFLRRPEGSAAAEAAFVADRPYQVAKEELLARFDREYCTDLLKRAEDNLSRAARMAGLERKHLYKVLDRAGVAPARARQERTESDD